MSNAKNETPGRSLRAFGVEEFCRRYGVGRTTAYAEIKAGRLPRRKIGRRSLIAEDDAEAWLHALPIVITSGTKV
jgi:excisionase family DNA binding protein